MKEAAIEVSTEYNELLKKKKHWIMQFQSFDWLSGHAVPAIIPCPRNSDHKLFSGCSCKAKSAKSSDISWMIKKYYSTRAC